jgi:hypothetical protein
VLLACLTLASRTVKAGTFDTEVRPFGNASQLASATVAVQSTDLNLTSGTGSYSYTWKDPAGILAPIQVTVPQVPAGYVSLPYKLDAPFSWDSTRISLYGVASDDPVDNAHVEQFVEAIQPNQPYLSDAGNVFSLYERSRAIFSARKLNIDQGASFYSCDVAVAYYLLLSARELVDRRNLQVDPVTKDAQSWLLGLATKKPKPPKSFVQAGVKVSDVIALNNQLSMRDSIVYAKLTNQIDSELQTDFASACKHARVLLQTIRNLPSYEYQLATAQGSVHLRAATDVAYCLAVQFAQAKSGEQPSREDAIAAKQAIADLDRLIPNASGPEQENAIGREADLRKYSKFVSTGLVL